MPQFPCNIVLQQWAFKMEMKPVNSSNITHVGYDAASQEMQVTFNSGKTYSYVGVEPEAHKAFVNSDSIGSHFAKNIRPNFSGKIV